MATITIARQMGSLGCQIANDLAQQLGYRYVWRDLINQAAALAGTPEMALAAIDELGLLDVCPSPSICKAYLKASQQIMEDLHREGNVVIVWRAGQVVLGGYSDVISICMYASKAVRAKRIAHRHQIPEECALAQIEESDRFRNKFLKDYYGQNWKSSELYHLVINTEKVAPSSAIRIITRLVSEIDR
jgi:cytidylate kinase